MPSGDVERLIDPIPPGSRLLHIGIPKTGTTSLQYAAAANRAELLRQGVRYPGHEINHRLAVSSLMGRQLGWKGMGASTPSPRVWTSLLAEVEADPGRRSFISHEFACESDDEQAAHFIEALGPNRIQVAISLRGFADLIASSRQQAIKSGDQRTFESWLKIVLADDAATKPTVFNRRNDQASLIDRWSRLVGPDRLTVVIAQKSRPEQLIDAFEDLLGLTRGALEDRPKGGYANNRTLSGGGRTGASAFPDLRRGLECIRLPDRRRSRRALRTGPLGHAAGRPAMPMEAAVEALVGLLSASDGMGAFFDAQEFEGLQFGQGKAATLISRSTEPSRPSSINHPDEGPRSQRSTSIRTRMRSPHGRRPVLGQTDLAVSEDQIGFAGLSLGLGARGSGLGLGIRPRLSVRASPAGIPWTAGCWSASGPWGSASSDGSRPGLAAGSSDR